jgi:hypothetical protein
MPSPVNEGISGMLKPIIRLTFSNLLSQLQNHLSFPNVFIGNMVFQVVRTGFPLRIAAGMTRMGSFAITSIYDLCLAFDLNGMMKWGSVSMKSGAASGPVV